MILHCENIVKTFGGLVALWRAHLQVEKGEILGLIGPNGSGKTTFINVISGQYTPEDGRILLDGEDVTRFTPHQLAHAGIARTYQIPRPFHSMTVIDNVAIGHMFGRHQHSRAESIKQAMEWLEFVGLAHKAKLPVGKLNLHERKFLEIARALSLEPKILLLDEVLAGLNPSEVDLGIALIRRIHDRGIALVFVEHNTRAVSALSDRVTVLNYGRNIASGTPEQVMQNPQVISAYLGQDYVTR